MSSTHTSESLDEDLHTSTEAENEVESGFLLDVVVRKSATVLKLLTSKDQTLLIRRDALLILNLLLDLVDGVSRLDLKSDRLTGESLNENLHVDVKRLERITKELKTGAAHTAFCAHGVASGGE
jgi:hypothetical protein